MGETLRNQAKRAAMVQRSAEEFGEGKVAKAEDSIVVEERILPSWAEEMDDEEDWTYVEPKRFSKEDWKIEKERIETIQEQRLQAKQRHRAEEEKKWQDFVERRAWARFEDAEALAKQDWIEQCLREEERISKWIAKGWIDERPSWHRECEHDVPSGGVGGNRPAGDVWKILCSTDRTAARPQFKHSMSAYYNSDDAVTHGVVIVPHKRFVQTFKDLIKPGRTIFKVTLLSGVVVN